MIKCDFCEKPAIRNYQKVWVSWVIVGNGYSKEPRVDKPRQDKNAVPGNPDNILVCQDHEKEFLDGNLKI